MLTAEIAASNENLKKRAIKLRIDQVRNSLILRGTWTDVLGVRKQRRIYLGVPANSAGLLEADIAAVEAWRAIKKGNDPYEAVAEPKVETKATQDPLKVRSTLERFEADYWATRKKTSAAIRTWSRISSELQRLPMDADLSLPLLEATICRHTEPDSRSRLEACKVYKRLALFAEIESAQKLSQTLDRLRGRYEPEERELPSDEQLIAFLDEVRNTKWGWVMCAATTFGVRPAEVPSLVLNATNHTASSLTVKRHGKKPELRTCFALPSEWIERWQLREVEIPNSVRWTRPENYDSAEAQRWVQAWRHGLRCKTVKKALEEHLNTGFENRIFRHCWAVRSIKSGLPTGICAKAMGHSVAIHERQYHRHLDQSRLESAMADLVI